MNRSAPGLLLSVFIIGCGDDSDANAEMATDTSPATTGSSAASGNTSAATTNPATSAPTSETTPTSSDGDSGPGDDDSTSQGSDGDSSGTAADEGTTGVPGMGCEASDYIVCEDFESAALGGNPMGWGLRPSGVFGGNGMGATDEDAAMGSQSFRLDGGQSGAQWLTYMGDISPFTDGHWGRLYFKMGRPIPWPQGGVIHGDFFEARGDWQGSTHQVRWAVIENNQMFHNWGYNVQTSNAGEFIFETGYTYEWPEDWFCIEWHHDRVAQTATLWVEGEEVLSIPPKGQDPQMPIYDDISVGWANYQPADPQFVVFLDEVVLDDERVGCGR